MRTFSILIVVTGLTVGIGAPASAKPTKATNESASANAFWYTTESLSGGRTRTSVWYVGVYQDGWGTFSDVYKDVTLCRTTRRGETCETEESLFGYADLGPEAFAIERATLGGAWLDAVYELYDYSGDREPGAPVLVHVVTSWTGVGDLSTDGGTFTFRSKCYSYRETFEGSTRSAEAYGSVNGASLGETYDAYLSAGTSSTMERTRTC